MDDLGQETRTGEPSSERVDDGFWERDGQRRTARRGFLWFVLGSIAAFLYFLRNGAGTGLFTPQ